LETKGDLIEIGVITDDLTDFLFKDGDLSILYFQK
jgi:hypothetical protein